MPKKNVGLICIESDYDQALKEIAPYFECEPEPGSTAAKRFDVLAALIDAYETKRWPIVLLPQA